MPEYLPLPGLSCCHLHKTGSHPATCCDPEDCGPCCENCPTCPSLNALHGPNCLCAICHQRCRGCEHPNCPAPTA